MKMLFSWMKSKVHGKDNSIKPEPESVSYEPCKEEVCGCPSTVLAIGTFGNDLKYLDKASNEEISPSNGDALDNIEELDRELRQSHNKQILLDSTTLSGESQSQHSDLSKEKILDIFPAEREITNEFISYASENNNVLLTRRGKDDRKKGIYRKSFSFLLKKALLCQGGFMPTPICRNPVPDPKLDNSIMGKILRDVLHEKKYPQRQKYLGTSGESHNKDQGGH